MNRVPLTAVALVLACALVAPTGGASAADNQPPVATDDDAGTITAGQSVSIDVLANDTDPDGDPLTITSVTDGRATIAHGARDTISLPERGDRQRHRARSPTRPATARPRRPRRP